MCKVRILLKVTAACQSHGNVRHQKTMTNYFMPHFLDWYFSSFSLAALMCGVINHYWSSEQGNIQQEQPVGHRRPAINQMGVGNSGEQG